MNKIIVLVCVLSLIFVCGCTGYREIDRGYMVTAVGLKKHADKTEIILETISPSDAAGNYEKTDILSGVGDTLAVAYKNLQNSLVKTVYFEQCGVVAIENTFTMSELTTLLEFCHTLPSLNIGVYVIATDDINALFESDNIMGYNIIGLIKNNAESKGTAFSNQLYSIERQLYGGAKFSLPIINTTDGKLNYEGDL